MARILDESELAESLRELTRSQPEPPVDRLAGVRRRYRRRRATLAVTAAAAIAVVAAGGVGLATALREPAAPAQIATQPLSWQLDWPDRSDGSVSKSSVLAWLGRQGYVDVRGVRWLYAGTPAGGTVNWAVLEAHFAPARGDTGLNGVLALSSVDHGATWLVASPPPPPTSTTVLGFAQRKTGTVLVLAAPGVRNAEVLTLQRDGAIGATSAVVRGIAVAHPNRLERDSVLVREPDAPSSYLVVFDNDAVSSAIPSWWAADPPRAATEALLGSASGGGGGGWGNVHSPVSGTLVLEVRCVGPVPVRYVVKTPAGRMTASVTRCDGAFHRYDVGPVRAGARLDISEVSNGGRVESVAAVLVRP